MFALMDEGHTDCVLVRCCVALSMLLLAGAVGAEVDADRDGMPDEYETFYGLNTTNRYDAQGNYDEDLLENLLESQLWTDPFAGDTDLDGWLDHEDDNPVSRCVLDWGSPFFTEGDYLNAWGPDWFVDAYRVGGAWDTNASVWRAEQAGSSLCIEMNRANLTNNLRLVVGYLPLAGESIAVSLYSANGIRLEEAGQSMTLSGTNETEEQTLFLPLSEDRSRAVIVLTSESGNACILYNILYIDEDGDGLDADQEAQLGTSDRMPFAFSAPPGELLAITEQESAEGFAGPLDSLTPSGTQVVFSVSQSAKPALIAREFRVYVNQLTGRDSFSGHHRVSRVEDGPKKTIAAGLSAVAPGGEVVIQDGRYREDLRVSGKPVHVRIEGSVVLE